MTKRNPDLIRVGDTVEIINRERFVRCGYNLNPEIAQYELVEKYSSEILEFLEKLDMPINPKINTNLEYLYKEALLPGANRKRAMNKFMFGLGFLYANRNNMGGSERKIFTVPFTPDEIGPGPYSVLDTRQVVTGDYYKPCGGYDSHNGEYYYETGGLHDQQNHRIVQISTNPSHRNFLSVSLDTSPDHSDRPGFWIEAKNLRKV